MDPVRVLYWRTSYNAEIGTNSQSQVAVIPIIASLTDEDGNRKRFISGIIIRGPQHTRSATDKINIVSIEIVNEYFDQSMIRNPKIVNSAGSRNFLVRRNTFKKVDMPFLMFINNSLFMPCNLMGDMLFRDKTIGVVQDIKIKAQIFLRDAGVNFFKDRVIDSMLMAIIGNARDEGYFAILRKLFMVMITMRRGEGSLSFDMKELCDKLNECLIDNPFGMYKHLSLLYALCVRGETE